MTSCWRCGITQKIQGASDQDGDSLFYSLVPAQGSSGDTLIYNPGYDYLTPFHVLDSPLTIESQIGLLSFTPIAPAITSVLSIQINEYNANGILIGSVKNDMQVFINDSCVADTLNFLGDTTTPTGSHPAITVFCDTNKLLIHFDNPIQCETISLDGSDFILTVPIGGTLLIDSIGTPTCTGGLIDSIVLYLSETVRFNGSYFLYDTIGNDGTPILSICGLVLNDTLEIILNNCVKATVDLMNVTVVNNSDISLIWGKYTENFEDSYFIKYEVLRSTDPLGPYTVIDYVSTFEDTFYLDQNVSVSNQEYNYTIRMDLDPSLFLVPESDSIQSILLQSSPAPTNDTNEVDLFWTPYWGWTSPNYQIMKKTANGPWKRIHETSETNYRYMKPLLANNYELKIMTSDNTFGLYSESNWISFEIPIRQIPNVITPNGDDINDFFFVNERLLYEQVHLIVYNRWGMKVFEDLKYNNKWDGDNFVAKPLPDGTYYYVLKLTEGENKAGFVTIIR
ncbi:MAG TPA: gliding motility-associated C-terminal domain-containing protein [Flavobacteriales bacterium]|nr:gliding motility-associated C-terminal domain-containing protein [Flavobacteriales bacterium]